MKKRFLFAFLACFCAATSNAAPANSSDDLLARAEKGDAQAQYELGMLYKNGSSGLAADTEAAVRQLAETAKSGLQKADEAINQIYDNRHAIASALSDNAEKAGDLVNQGIDATRKWWSDLTKSDVAKDAQKAVDWLTKSARQGNAAAQNQLGELYWNGTGVKQDKDTAAQWFKKSCDNGNQEGCRNWRKASEKSF